jgi:hypothetical protein
VVFLQVFHLLLRIDQLKLQLFDLSVRSGERALLAHLRENLVAHQAREA